MASKGVLLKMLADAVLNYNPEVALSAAKEAIENGVDPLEAIEHGLSVGMREVGVLFARAEYPLPYVMLAADAMNAAMEYFKGFIPKDRMPKPVATIVLATVAGDIHDIGAKIVAAVFEAAGFKVYFLGRDIPNDQIIKEAERVEADIIGLSSFMTSTMFEQKLLINALEKRGLRHKYKVMVGGGPISDAWCEEISADGYAPDAISALEKAKRITHRK